MKLHWMKGDELCTEIIVEDSQVSIVNHTANILDCAFGANTSPTIKDFDEFLEDRSIPKTRHHFSMQCAMHGISDTSVLGIVKHFQGRCAGDSYWINFLD